LSARSIRRNRAQGPSVSIRAASAPGAASASAAGTVEVASGGTRYRFTPQDNKPRPLIWSVTGSLPGADRLGPGILLVGAVHQAEQGPGSFGLDPRRFGTGRGGRGGERRHPLSLHAAGQQAPAADLVGDGQPARGGCGPSPKAARIAWAPAFCLSARSIRRNRAQGPSVRCPASL
jgi:hypothetical protein